MPQPPNRWTLEEDQLLRQEVLAQRMYSDYFISPSPIIALFTNCNPCTAQCITVSQGDVRDWQTIAVKLPGRTNKDCRKRWHNVVAGGMNKGHWTDAEDKLLIDAVNTHGKRSGSTGSTPF